MSSNTADSLGLSRAILCNDSLVKRLQELQATESMYRGLVEHCKRYWIDCTMYILFSVLLFLLFAGEKKTIKKFHFHLSQMQPKKKKKLGC